MADPDLRRRQPAVTQEGAHAGFTTAAPELNVPLQSHQRPSEVREAGVTMQVLRAAVMCVWMNMVCVASHLTQFMGAPLYFFDKDQYYAWMAMTKRSFGLLIITITQWFAPTKVRISAEKACRAQMKLDKDGKLESTFPERLVLIANHQLYSDWIFLWWISYTSRMHGYIYIILKESLKYVPVVGPGMMFYGFIFMARNWARDKSRLQYRLQKLNSKNGQPMKSSSALDPMWLLIFPEGTNLSANTRRKSAAFAAKSGQKDFKHQLLPRSTGLHFCLQELKDTVEWVYDCTVAYEGIPPGQYGQDVYTNRGIYFGGRPPKSVNMYWRRFHVPSIPLLSQEDFEAWVMDRWREKEALLEHYSQTGRFPSDTDTPTSSLGNSMVKVEDKKSGGLTSSWAKGLSADRINLDVPGAKGSGLWADGSDAEVLETSVQYRSWTELIAIFIPLLALAAVAFVGASVYNVVRYGDRHGWVETLV